MAKKSTWALTVLIALALIALFFGLRSGTRERSGGPAAAPAPTAVTDTSPERAALDDPGFDEGTDPGISDLVGVAVQQNSEQLRAAVEEYKHLHRYGVESRPLTKEMIDVLNPNIYWPAPHPIVGVALFEKAGRAPQDEETQKKIMAEALWQSCEANQYRFVGEEPVTISLATYRAGEPPERVDVSLGPTTITTIDGEGTEQLIGETRLERLAKTVGGDPQYVTVWRAPAALENFTGQIRFSTTWTPEKGGDPGECMVLIHHTGTPPGKFSGTFADRLDEGSLLVDVGVEIFREEEGTYQFDGRVFAADGETPVAYASAQATLAKGEHTVSLLFYGLVFREMQVSGPYVLKGLTAHLATTGKAGRGPEFVPYWDPYRTAAYDYRAFTDKEWTSEENEARIKVYEKLVTDAEEAERRAAAQDSTSPR